MSASVAQDGPMQLPAAVRVIHPAPALAVTTLGAALAAILATQAGESSGWRVVLVVASVAGSQIFTGALNDWADHGRDTVARPEKPIPAGDLSPPAALAVAGGGLALQLATSAALGVLPLLLGAGASTAALAYNLWLSRTPLSVVPYLVAFGLLPLWVAAGVGVPLERVAPAALLVAPFAAAAHLANTVRDWEADAVGGSRSLAQVLGQRLSHHLAVALAIGVGLGVGVALAAAGELRWQTGAPGVIGLVAVSQGARDARRLWYGMLVAAVAWTVAWALATG
jgi:heme o synthase